MKSQITILIMVFFFFTSLGFSQKGEPESIISGKVSIAKYHDRDQLDKMQKGQLLDLYNERIEVIVNILPNIAFATKPGVTMTTLGIPDTKENRKALDDNKQASKTYFDSTIDFQKRVLPYSDKSNLISAILFYEQTLKSLHTYNEFN